MKRRLYAVSRVAVILLGLAAVTFWARSYRTYDDLAFTWCRADTANPKGNRWGHVTVGTRAGRLLIRHENDRAVSPRLIGEHRRGRWVEHTAGPAAGGATPAQFRGAPVFQLGGFAYLLHDETRPVQGPYEEEWYDRPRPVMPMERVSGGTFFVPLWAIALLTAVAAIGPAARAVQRWRRRRRGLCVGCGFDLRASGDRCPECGREAPPTAAAPVAIDTGRRAWRRWGLAALGGGAAFAAAAAALHPPAPEAPTADPFLDAPPVPSAPHGVTAVAVDGHNVRLAWRDEGGDRDRYVIEAFSAATGWALRKETPGDARSCDVSVRSDNTRHSLRLRAKRESRMSAPSEVVTVATPLAHASKVEPAVVSPREVDVSWWGSSRAGTGYDLERSEDGKPFNRVSAKIWGGGTELRRVVRDTGVRPGRKYGYRVRNVNGTAASPYSPAAFIRTPPEGPGHVPTTSPSLDTREPPPDENPPGWAAYSYEDSFVAPPTAASRRGPALRRAAAAVVAFAAAAGGWMLLARLLGGRARAAGPLAAAAAAWVAALWAVWPVRPAAPTGFTATAPSPWFVQFSWADRSLDASEFAVEWAVAGSGQWESFALGVREKGSARAAARADGTWYDFRIRAVNAVGASDPSPPARAFVPLAAPSTLEGRFSNQWIDLRWESRSKSHRTRIERWEPGGHFVEAATVPSHEAQFLDTATRAGGRYVYRLRAERGDDVLSPWVRVAVPPHPPLESPPTPAGVAAAAGQGPGGKPVVTVRWKDELRVTRYVIRRHVGEKDPQTIHHADAAEQSYTDAGVSPGGTYAYSVAGLNRDAYGNFSDPVTVVVPGPATRPSEPAVLPR